MDTNQPPEKGISILMRDLPAAEINLLPS